MTILSYKDASGFAHWPDAQLGSEKYYGVDWDDFLTSENDTISSIAWVLPSGLTELDDSQVANQARVKFSADSVGSYEVSCKIATAEVGDTQIFIQKMLIEVV